MKTNHKWLLGILILTLLLTTGCSTSTTKPYNETLALSVDDTKVYLDEIMYHVLLAELEGQLYAAFLGSEEDYWQTKDAKGVTMAETAKQQVQDNAIKYEILYKKATSEGYTLTAEEKTIAANQVKSILENVQPDKLANMTFTEEKLLAIQEKIALSTRYYNDYVTELGVNEADITKQISKDDYKQLDMSYVFVGTLTKDDQGNVVSVPEATKKLMISKMTNLSESMKAATTKEEISKLTLPEGFSSGSLSLLVGQNTFGEESILEEKLLEMQPDEVSSVIETTKGYYLLKLRNNTSIEKYDAAVAKVIEEAKTNVFNVAFAQLKKEHTIKIEKKAWDSVVFGGDVLKTK